MSSLYRNNSKFQLKGHRSFLRTDDEINFIDKNEADSAFKIRENIELFGLPKSH